MRTYFVNKSTALIALYLLMMLVSGVAQAKLDIAAGFFENHFHYEATSVQGGTGLGAQFNYTADNTLFTSNSIKMNNDGFENHAMVKIVQNVGAVVTNITYKLNQYSYSGRDDKSNDAILDLQYRSLHMQYRREEALQISTIGIPYDISAAHFEASVSHTLQNISAEPIDAYSIISQVKNMKVVASWQHIGGKSWVDYNTVHRPSACWLMMYGYSNHGDTRQQLIRSEYTNRLFRLSGEYSLQTDIGNNVNRTVAIDIQKKLKLTVLKMGLGYSDHTASTTFAIKVETHLDI